MFRSLKIKIEPCFICCPPIILPEAVQYIIKLRKREERKDEAKESGVPKKAFKLSENDRRFLRSIRIGCDEGVQEQADNSPPAAQRERKLLPPPRNHRDYPDHRT